MQGLWRFFGVDDRSFFDPATKMSYLRAGQEPAIMVYIDKIIYI
jgi:hypothetical protein